MPHFGTAFDSLERAERRIAELEVRCEKLQARLDELEAWRIRVLEVAEEESNWEDE